MSFLVLAYFAKHTSFQLQPFYSKRLGFTLFMAEYYSIECIYHIFFIWWTYGLIPYLSFCKLSCYKHGDKGTHTLILFLFHQPGPGWFVWVFVEWTNRRNFSISMDIYPFAFHIKFKNMFNCKISHVSSYCRYILKSQDAWPLWVSMSPGCLRWSCGEETFIFTQDKAFRSHFLHSSWKPRCSWPDSSDIMPASLIYSAQLIPEGIWICNPALGIIACFV